MIKNYSKDIRKNLTEIQNIALSLNIPTGKYLQIVNRCGKIALSLNKQERAYAKGAVLVEVAPSPSITHDDVVAEMEKREADRNTVLSWLQDGKKVTTVDCIEHNILRASDVIYRLRKSGWPIATKLIKRGRSRIAEYTLLGPKLSPQETNFKGFEQ